MYSLTFSSILLLVLGSAWACTNLIIRQAVRWGLQDVPNERSSHVRPTPRGGGAAIVVGSLTGFGLLGLGVMLLPHVIGHMWPDPDTIPAWVLDAGGQPPYRVLEELTHVVPLGLIPLAGALIMAVTGLKDDRKPMGIRDRLLLQAFASTLLGLCLYSFLGGKAVFWHQLGLFWQAIGLPGSLDGSLATNQNLLPILLAGATAAALLVACVWWINLFNFMDGIDGIAACQAIFMLLAATWLRGGNVLTEPLSLISLIMAAATAGFLVLNWAPARIFMGDAGSLFLGYSILSVAALDSAISAIGHHQRWQQGALSDAPDPGGMTLWVWLILGALFITDATVTLMRRALSGQNVGGAHRSHAYQRLSRHYNSHARATLVYCLLNVFWLLPIAWIAHRWPESAASATGIAYTPLILLAWHLGAGRQDPSPRP
ncbi:MAG: hypothetical protein Q4D91_09795 [Lautropia sp.]|nr:hypothetical protein [Lautropia sp.]